MKQLFLALLCLFTLLNRITAQPDVVLRTYSVHSKLNEECTAEVAVTLFDQAAKKDSMNQVILEQLMQGFYDVRKSVSLNNLYEESVFPPSREFNYTLLSACSYHKNGLYSFIACAYNVCDKAPRSNFEPNCITVDLRSSRVLSLYDIIEPAKKDSFEKYVYHTAMRYHIRNTPSCYVAGTSPLQVKGSSSMTTGGDTIIYASGLTERFYLRDNYLFVNNLATHRDYNYNSVEVMLNLLYIRYFLRKEILDRMVL